MKNDLINLFSTDEEQTRKIKKWHKQPWRTYYSLFVSKEKRKQQKLHANLLQKKHVAKLWNIFLEQYFQNKLEYFQLKPKKELLNQKIIWQYWGQGLEQEKLPDLVKLCFASVDEYKADYQVIRLDEHTIREYLDLPDFVWEKKKNPQFKPAFFADLLRLALLDVYGGVWIDATILLTAPIEQKLLNQDFFMFHRDEIVQNKEFWQEFNQDYFGWNDEHYVNVLNSFIVSKQRNNIVHICLDVMLNYWKTQNNIPHYFFFQIMFNELMNHYLTTESMQILDDTKVHLLQIIQNDRFNQEQYDLILKQMGIHKLNYVKLLQQKSYYEHLLSIYKI